MRAVVALFTVFALVSGCSLSGGDGNAHPSGERTVVLVTHDSFAYTPQLFDDFRASTGIRIEVRKTGDAGALTNQLVLTKANPLGDLAFGVDNTFASRALTEGVFAEYRSPDADQGPQRYQADGSGRLTAVDVGDVCVNVDVAGLAGKGVPQPTSFEDLADPRYKGMVVTEDPSTSSPGLAFLMGSIAHFGEQGWQAYWSKLKDNGLKVDSGWEEAYTQDFSGSSGKGPQPIVVSYASSPSAEIGADGKSRTKALLDTCFRQVEYAGVLAGAKNPDDAKRVLDFLISEKFQADVPGQMYVYPAREGVALPKDWAQAPLPANPASVAPADIQSNRDRWISQWRTLFND